MRLVNILEIRVFGRLTLVLLLLWSMNCAGQKSNRVNLFEFKYGLHYPLGDLQDRFGSNNDFAISLQSVNINSKVFFGLEGSYLFGNSVKEDVLYQLRSFDGTIIGIDGKPGDINLKERGFYLGLNAGKIFSTTTHKNKLTGIRAQIGGGLLQHKIRVQDNGGNVVQVEKKYLQGYDRLTNGPTVRLGLGYQYQSPANNFHFHIMGDLYGARTASRRDIDYATGQYLDAKRTEILAGFSLAYVVSISRANAPENIYY